MCYRQHFLLGYIAAASHSTNLTRAALPCHDRVTLSIGDAGKTMTDARLSEHVLCSAMRQVLAWQLSALLNTAMAVHNITVLLLVANSM
jgi:hypothetical protein